MCRLLVRALILIFVSHVYHLVLHVVSPLQTVLHAYRICCISTSAVWSLALIVTTQVVVFASRAQIIVWLVLNSHLNVRAVQEYIISIRVHVSRIVLLHIRLLSTTPALVVQTTASIVAPLTIATNVRWVQPFWVECVWLAVPNRWLCSIITHRINMCVLAKSRMGSSNSWNLPCNSVRFYHCHLPLLLRLYFCAVWCRNCKIFRPI